MTMMMVMLLLLMIIIINKLNFQEDLFVDSIVCFF